MPKTNQTMTSFKSGRGTARSITWASPSAYNKKDIGEPGNPAGRNSVGDGGLTARSSIKTERALEPPPPPVSSSRDDLIRLITAWMPLYGWIEIRNCECENDGKKK